MWSCESFTSCLRGLVLPSDEEKAAETERNCERAAATLRSFGYEASAELHTAREASAKALHDIRRYRAAGNAAMVAKAEHAGRVAVARVRDMRAKEERFSAMEADCVAKSEQLREFRQYKTVVGVMSDWRTTVRRMNLPELVSGAEASAAEIGEIAMFKKDIDDIIVPSSDTSGLSVDDLEAELEELCSVKHEPAMMPAPPEQTRPTRDSAADMPRVTGRVVSQDEYARALEAKNARRVAEHAA